MTHYAVIGLGISGTSAALALLEDGHDVTVYDDTVATAEAFLAAHATQDRLYIARTPDDLGTCTDAICSPGIPFTHPAPHPAIQVLLDTGCRISCDIDIMYRRTPDALHIAITGTNGKSTTTALIAHALHHDGRETLLAGNIGTAAATVRPETAHPAIMTECSSFQLDLIADYSPHIAVWLNITPDHIDRHGDMSGYVTAKAHLFDRQTPNDTACIGVDDRYSREMAEKLRARDNAPRVITFSAHNGSGADIIYDNQTIIDTCNGVTVTMPQYLGIGAASRQNLAACYAAFTAAGEAPDAFPAAVSDFTALPHRMENLGDIQGISCINDSKATNADAARCALEAYPGSHWILGGKAKSDGITPLANLFHTVRHAYTIGDAGPAFAEELRAAGVPVTECGTLEKAVNTAYAALTQEKEDKATMLFSPACASFDQFTNFAERGDVFKRYVREHITHLDKS